ncbi:MAG: DUF4827 family protein [Bacteroidales bacterium]|nr:DUF4827 family protein [Bacteroidales bacterium]
MKNNKIIVLLFLLLALVGCESSTNYSKQLEDEKKQIETYLSKNGFTVVEEFPEDSVFADNIFYYSESEDIYFRLDVKGTGDTIKSGDKLQVRYIESTLEDYPVVESYWTTMDLEYPIEVTYGGYDNTNTCTGWNSAFAMMQRSGAVAQVIVPSYKGFSWATTTTSLIPYLYKLTFQVLPK